MVLEDLTSLKDMLTFQFNISWQLLDYHLGNLEHEEVLWKPSKKSLHVYKKGNEWIADWPETEAYEIGPASIAWTTWHILFWWSMVFDHSFGEGTLTKDSVKWPENIETVKQELQMFYEKWTALLETVTPEELLAKDKTNWPFEGLPFYQLAGWLNVELMKNAAEIGSIRFMYATRAK